MSLLINFKDAVNASVLDPNATVAVFYCDGLFENEAAVRARCPHARLYAITTQGATGKGIFACDSETGDLTIAETVAWVGEQVRLGASPIVVYADADRWLNLGLLSDLAHYGNRIERWDANYDGSPNIPKWASAKQYATGSVDLDVARADFFRDAPSRPDPHYDRFDTKRRAVYGGGSELARVKEYDQKRALQTPVRHPDRPRLAVLRLELGAGARRLGLLGHPEKFNRKWRKAQLYARADGHRVV